MDDGLDCGVHPNLHKHEKRLSDVFAIPEHAQQCGAQFQQCFKTTAICVSKGSTTAKLHQFIKLNQTWPRRFLIVKQILYLN